MSHEPEAHSEPYVVFADGCDECGYRAAQGVEALAYLDTDNRRKVGQMATGNLDAKSTLDEVVAVAIRKAAYAVAGCDVSLDDFRWDVPPGHTRVI